MPNYCPNCGNKIEPRARFCSSCGTKLEVQLPPEPIPSAAGGILQQLNIRMEDLVDQQEASLKIGKTDDSLEESFKKFNGLLLLTRDELIFVFAPEELKRMERFRKGKRMEKLREPVRVPLSTIDRAGKSWGGNIWYTVEAPEGAGFWGKLVSQSAAGGGFKIKDPESFIEKLKELNPNVK